MRHMDLVLDIAATHRVKIIMPIVNQDYGGDEEKENFVGNTTDLIRMVCTGFSVLAVLRVMMSTLS